MLWAVVHRGTELWHVLDESIQAPLFNDILDHLKSHRDLEISVQQRLTKGSSLQTQRILAKDVVPHLETGQEVEESGINILDIGVPLGFLHKNRAYSACLGHTLVDQKLLSILPRRKMSGS